MIKELGSFEVTSGKVRVCDPSYSKYEKDILVLENVLPGKYYANIEVIDTGVFGERVACLNIRHEYYDTTADNLFAEGAVGVDSGQAGFFDEDFYPNGDDTGNFDDTKTFYGKACTITLSEKQAGVIDNFGVVSRTGYGDGVYDVYVNENVSGQIVTAAIDYGVNEEDGGNEHEED